MESVEHDLFRDDKHTSATTTFKSEAIPRLTSTNKKVIWTLLKAVPFNRFYILLPGNSLCTRRMIPYAQLSTNCALDDVITMKNIFFNCTESLFYSWLTTAHCNESRLGLYDTWLPDLMADEMRFGLGWNSTSTTHI